MTSASVIALELGFEAASFDTGARLHQFLSSDARFTPDFVDLAEPVREAFPPANEFVAKWWNLKSRLEGGMAEGIPWPTFLKKKGSNGFTMTVKMPFQNKTGHQIPGRLYYKGRPRDAEAMDILFTGLAAVFEPDFGVADSFGLERPVPDLPTEQAADWADGYFGTAGGLDLPAPYRWLTARADGHLAHEILALSADNGPFDIKRAGAQIIASPKAGFYHESRFSNESFNSAFGESKFSSRMKRFA